MRVPRSLLLRAVLVGPGLMVQHAPAQSGGRESFANNSGTSKQFMFEVVSVRPHKAGTEFFHNEYLPDGYRTSFTVEGAIRGSYFSKLYLRVSTTIANLPGWEGWFDLDARVAPEDMPAWQQSMNRDGTESELLHSAMRTVLEQQFKLKLHMTTIEVACTEILVSKSGAKLADTVPGAIKPVPGKTSELDPIEHNSFYIDEKGKRQFVGATMDELALAFNRLSRDACIVDKTGLKGRYDFTIPWYDYANYPDSEIGNPFDRMPLTSVGLMLRPGKAQSFNVSIDHVEIPNPN
jgi:uncharacterized protein (TIGR03435 family)